MEAAMIAPISLTSSNQISQSQQYVQAIAFLTAGMWCTKFPFEHSQSKPKSRFLFYGVDEVDGECLYWCDSVKKKRSKDRMIPFHSITSLVESIQTAAFKRAMTNKQSVTLTSENANACFSIVGKKRTLDLQCADQPERERFVAALHVILMHNKQQNPQSNYQPANQSTIYSAFIVPVNSSAATAKNMSNNQFSAPQRDMFVISVKARNLPVMPWTDDDTNDTIVCVYEKNARTASSNPQTNGYQLVESSEWQLNNQFPNFKTPLLIPFMLPLQPTDLIKFCAFDRVVDDAHLVGSAVVRASALMNNAGHEMMVKLKNSAAPPIDKLLQGNNAYLLLTSTCKTGGSQSNSSAARPPVKPVAAPAQPVAQPKPPAAVAPNQPFTNVIQEYSNAIQNNKKSPATAPITPANNPPAVHRSSVHQDPRGVQAAPVGRRSTASARSHQAQLSQPTSRRSSIDQIFNQSLMQHNKSTAHLVVEPTTRQRSASTQLPKTTLSFLQAGDQFFIFPPKKSSNQSVKQLTDRCSTSMKLVMEGDYGTLVLSAFQEGCDSDNEVDPTNKSKEITRIPFELIYQAKIGIGPGCFNRTNPAIKVPKAPRCFSLLIKDRAASDARIDYWLDIECRSSNKRDAWVAAFNQLISYIHLPTQSALNHSAKHSLGHSVGHSVGHSTHHKSSKDRRRSSIVHASKSVYQSVNPSSAPSPSETTPSTPVEFVSPARSTCSSVKSKAAESIESRVQELTGDQPTTQSKHSKQVIAGVLVDADQSTETEDESAFSFDQTRNAKRSVLDVARNAGMKLGFSNLLQPRLDELEIQLSGAPRSSIIKDSRISSVPTAPAVVNDDVIVIGEGIPMAPDMPFAPPMAPSMDGPSSSKPAVRLRKLHWQTIDTDDQLQGTIWTDELVDQSNVASSDAIDQEAHEMLIKLFSLKSTERKKKDDESVNGTMKSRGIFDSKRGQNIEIALKSFRMPYSALYEAVQSIDFTILNIERVVSLVNCCPTADELVLMKAWEQKQKVIINQSDNPTEEIDYTVLPAAEQFAFLMQSIPRYHWRLRSILFVLKFDDLVEHCTKGCLKLSKTCQSIRQSMRFRHILQLIVSIGNTMNRTQAKAFHLSSLTALSSTKSTDGKTHLIDFLVMYIDRLQQLSKQSNQSKMSSSSAHGYLSELTPPVRAACLMDLNQLAADRSSLIDGLEELQNELQSQQSGDDSDVFQVTMSEFVDRAQSKADALNSSWSSFTESSRSLLLYLNEVGSLTLSESLECIDAFLSQFAASEVKLEQSKIEQKKQSQAHSRQQSVTNLSSQPMEAIMREHVGRMRQDSGTWTD